MMHGNILRYFMGKKRRFSPHKKAASDTNKQSPKEREREKERRRGWLLVVGRFYRRFFW